MATVGVPVIRACALAQCSRAAWYRPLRAKDHTAHRGRIRELAMARPRFGFQRIWAVLRREGWLVILKRVRRLYRLEGLQVRMRVRRRKRRALHRGSVPRPTGPAQRWSMDVVHDTLADGRPFRLFDVVDQASRQRPILDAGFRLNGTTVGAALDSAIVSYGKPASITGDYGTGCM
jgi:putative transposase